MADERPSIAELQRNDAQHTVNGVLWDTWPVLLEIAAAALALREQQFVAARATANAAADGTDEAYDRLGQENLKLANCREAYDSALAKVRQ